VKAREKRSALLPLGWSEIKVGSDTTSCGRISMTRGDTFGRPVSFHQGVKGSEMGRKGEEGT